MQIHFEGEALFPWAAGGSPQWDWSPATAWEPATPGAPQPPHRAVPGLAGQSAFSWAFQRTRFGQENLF